MLRYAKRRVGYHTHGRSHDLAPDYVYQCVQSWETAADNVGGPWIARGRGRWAKLSRLLFNPRLLAAAHADTIPHIPVRSIRFTWDVGTVRFSSEIGFFDDGACSTNPGCRVQTPRIVSVERAVRSGNQPANQESVRTSAFALRLCSTNTVTVWPLERSESSRSTKSRPL